MVMMTMSMMMVSDVNASLNERVSQTSWNFENSYISCIVAVQLKRPKPKGYLAVLRHFRLSSILRLKGFTRSQGIFDVSKHDRDDDNDDEDDHGDERCERVSDVSASLS